MTFIEKIKSAQAKTNSKLCIGLDTALANVPEFLHGESNPVLAFNKAIIDATKDLACAYKPNLAYYEAYGAKGIEALEGTLTHIPSDIFTIADVKRGDIGATSDQYALAYQELYPFDSVTISPYMGSDSVQSFLGREDRGVFFLGLTSNQGAKDFQYLELQNGKKLYEEVTDKVREWSKAKKNCGLVVGATKASELKALRERAPELPFLVPGIGAQGGSLRDVLEANGNGIALINVSRAVCGASKGKDFAEAARAAAEKLVEEMR
ncbi:MAG: orotidine-5'-phosphate decarboxylase [Bacteroidota bacterium]|nr:orotidine-5'-phosphate decarboxylase [Bacteroidota bacterium]MDP4230671.1 orotidine-5'-phosphate decarboxylase [Bacteroidota bacterium]MDP4235361.1 orotidine-5'-phosphate decarboxylase [Bacteroidota bacterium]